MNHLLHVLNLDTIGGVEHLFRHFLCQVSKNFGYKHSLLVTSSSIHPYFKEDIRSFSQSIYFEKKWFGLRLPKIKRLRQYAISSALRTISPDRIIFWNRFCDLTPYQEILQTGCQAIYYDHGASWIEPIQSDNIEFLNFMTRVICISTASEKMLRLKWGYNRQLDVLQNPLRPDIAIVEAPKHLKENQPFAVGYAGRLIPLKGVSLLIHAIAQLVKDKVPVRALIAGVGPELENLKKLKLKLQLNDDQVQYLGQVKDMNWFYQSIDALVIPSIREPLGLVALEAQAQGCPVIATRIDGLAEAVKEHSTGILVDPRYPLSDYPLFDGNVCDIPSYVYFPKSTTIGKPKIINPYDLAKSIKELASSPDFYNKLSINCIHQMKAKPSFSDYANQLLNLVSKG